MPDGLRLKVTEYADLTRWRWVLKDANGAILADREVRLDPASQDFEMFTALHDYVSWHAAPDKRIAEEARIVAALGDWIGAEVFGTAIGSALVQRRPATVEVVLPTGAEAIAYLPLEATRVEGRSLASHGITLVIRPPSMDGVPARALTTDTLRVLGLFSLPDDGTALNLRRERQSLVHLIQKIAASGRAASVKALQYGVTRDKLRDILEEGDGWDVIHISGHGTPGELVLETADGHPDRISAADLADLLDVARGRVQLVTVSACWSAALATAEPRRLLGLPTPEDQRHFSPERIVASPPSQPPAFGDIATVLAERLGCAVLAMRFPIGDEFAIELCEKLYDLLAEKGQPLPRAVGLTLRYLAESGQGLRFPALSMAAPAIFGTTATALTLKAPPRTNPVSYAAENLKMAGFPPQPDRFVGRTAVMTRASAALAAESGIPGVLLHGMPGGGKTACALELAYTHEDAFDKLIWFKTSDEGTAIDGSLTDFALTLERKLPGFQMIHVMADDSKLTAFLPTLTELLERSRVLIVIDNAESLFTDTGQWRDHRWNQVVGALTGHSGFGRVIMTSRRVPADTSPTRVEAVDALTLNEGLLLARELPNLRNLMYGTLDGIGENTARKLAADVLKITQGHPKLLELADGQAANPDQLIALLQVGAQAWLEHGGLPSEFFTSAQTSADPGDYLSVLTAWTNTVTDTLSPGERDLFWFLCCLEEPDRERFVLSINWDDLWQQLDRNGDPPALDPTLAAVIARGLVTIRKGGGDERESYAIHPGVAAAGRDRAGPDFQDEIDAEAAAFWYAVFEHMSGKANGGRMNSGLQVRAGLAAVPYLVRRQEWEAAASLLHNAFILDPSRANAAAALPTIKYITRHDPRQASILATILQILDPAVVETQLRAFIDTAAARSDYRAAATATGQLIGLCRNSGRLAQALALTKQKADYVRQAGLGPWTQLFDEVQRLQILNLMGHARQVLDDIDRLLDHMNTLPTSSRPDEAVNPWNVHEMLLETGRHAAILLGRWQGALDLNAALAASMRDRRAPAAAIAGTRFNDFGPLLRLGRTDDALALLLDCRQTFHDTRDFKGLGNTFTALADVEDERGHSDAAIRLTHDALRYTYLAGDVTGTAVSYHNLGEYFRLRTNQPIPAMASHLTAALIHVLTGAGGADGSVRNAALDLRVFGTATKLPIDVADLCRKLGGIPGTDPAGLIAKLSPDPETAERTLQDLITQVQALAQEMADKDQR